MSQLNPLNPSTGVVPVPENPDEIAASLRAGRITQRLFPYFIWRYGDRGREFTRSDSAWLAWLTRHEVSLVIQQTNWLGSVLSNRGMPRWLLEVHLRVMHRQLMRLNPEGSRDYEKLLIASEQFRESRQAMINDDEREALAGEFAESLGGSPDWVLRGAGRLIVSAVADHAGGLKNSVSRLRDWLTDMKQMRALSGLKSALSGRQCQLLESDDFVNHWTQAIDHMIDRAGTIARKSRKKWTRRQVQEES